MSRLDIYIEHLEDAEKPCTLHCENGEQKVYVPNSAGNCTPVPIL